MADRNVQLRTKNGSIWDALFPETTLDQIIGSTLAGRNLLALATPAVDSYVQVEPDGDVSFIAKTSVADLIGAAVIGHGHSISEVNIPQVGGTYNGLTLQQALDAKATISGGKVLDANIPLYLFSGMKFKRLLTATQSLNDLVTEYTLPADANNHSMEGYWFEAVQDTTISFTSACEVLAPGDEGDYTTGMVIEAGDWLIYRGYSGTKYQFSIANNTYGLAATNHRGTAKISLGSITKRALLSNTSNGEKVIDEKALRTVMKDIHYGTTSPDPNSVSGDIWIYG